MKSIKQLSIAVCILFFTAFNTQAATYNFDGSLTVYIASIPQETSAATGFVEFDLIAGTGNGGTITGAPSATLGGVAFSNISIYDRGNSLFDVGFTITPEGSSSYGDNIIWKITELGDGTLSALTVDDNGINIADAIAAGGLPFKKIRIALDGILTPVPVPAAFWLFSSGLLGLIGLNRYKTTN